MSISRIYHISLKDIKLSALNVRLTDRNRGIEELADSIRKHGLLQPIVLKGLFGNPPYEVVVGQRRFNAFKRLKEKEIPSVFSDATTDLDFKTLSLAENMHRLELNYADKAEAITSLYLEYGKNANRVARELGLSYPTVAEYIKIEEQATEKAKSMLRKRSITKADVKRAINAAQGDKKKMDRLLDAMPKLTKYEKDRAVSYGRKERTASAKDIIKEAKTPTLNPTVILTLSQQTDTALDKAEKKMLMDRGAIASLALEKWLKDNGFL